MCLRERPEMHSGSFVLVAIIFQSLQCDLIVTAVLGLYVVQKKPYFYMVLPGSQKHYINQTGIERLLEYIRGLENISN